MIGKRKRETRGIARSVEAHSLVIAQTRDRDIFRRCFESRFEPLQEVCTQIDGSLKTSDDLGTSSDAASLSDWDGLSEGDSTPGIEIIEHGKREPPTSANDGQHAKKFMSSKPPLLGASAKINGKRQDQPSAEETAAEAINLKHDIELQRLLKESHFLNRSLGSNLTPSSRHKAIDVRMQSLGAKSSLFKQAKMPLSHHKGIIARNNQRKASRRTEAKENGIVLEKDNKERDAKNVRRERGVGAPTVGKFKDGTLKLSRQDISAIQGTQSSRYVARRNAR
ncbi:hypothetical protein EPUS_01088 [Endocarpon pusillum Z07020]|uniref:Uncharacterized protein n=1 Tax=Endocarpon pusillum (strain Z07020 / HMAS-L-300199) TaxID=1263415 RepID=U1FWC4_ENDPU|nr:uncharacterized protein EPUS_01088 [Endocarpon pusillum Z07020]ERF69132.1 hypothetical protein EPUS_01088 [Endocarpon pusillum Z07020]